MTQAKVRWMAKPKSTFTITKPNIFLPPKSVFRKTQRKNQSESQMAKHGRKSKDKDGPTNIKSRKTNLLEWADRERWMAKPKSTFTITKPNIFLHPKSVFRKTQRND